MLVEGDRFMGISEVAASAAFGKEAVADALENLHRGGLLDAAEMRNQRIFRVGRREQLSAVVEPLPDPGLSRPWHAVLPLMAGFLEATDLAETPAMARAADIQRRWREWQTALSRLGIVTAQLGAGTDYLRDYEDFTLRALRIWSSAAAPVKP